MKEMICSTQVSEGVTNLSQQQTGLHSKQNLVQKRVVLNCDAKPLVVQKTPEPPMDKGFSIRQQF
jgi:hypothetical protein